MNIDNTTDTNPRFDGGVGTSGPIEHGVGRDSWKVMFDRLYTDLSSLYEREGLLIRAEFNEKITSVKASMVSIVIGGLFLFCAVFAAVGTIIVLLEQVMALWASFALVAAVLFIVGGIMINAAKKKLEAYRLKPRHSLETLGEIRSTFKERINEFKSHH